MSSLLLVEVIGKKYINTSIHKAAQLLQFHKIYAKKKFFIKIQNILERAFVYFEIAD